MRKSDFLTAALTILALLPLCAPLTAEEGAAALPEIDIAYERFVLDNGLTFIVHEDHKAPIVAVNVWYHVGSKNEPHGKSGFAHLFEHLMFNGSENFQDDYFQALERVGATDLNGTTNEDRTNYFQNVPTSALDMVLWLESDRMGHLLGAIDQAKLDEQRGVVQNEKRQFENQPYNKSYELIQEAVYPAAHPYSHSIIGSMEDLDAASLDDVHKWFETSYGAANATLVLAGDIDPETARQKVEKYFGDIPPGPPVTHFQSWIAKRSGSQRQVTQDRVAQARLYKVWNVPAIGSADADYLDLLSDVLVSDKGSRLYKRLVYDDQIATQVSAVVDAREIGSLFQIEATARPGDDLSKVEAAVDEELARLLEEGPTEAELERVRTQHFASFVRGAERIGGFGGKSDILAQSQVYLGSPDAYKDSLQRIASATVDDLHQAARKWLADGNYTLEIVPYPDYAPSETGADRSRLPATGAAPEPSFPAMSTATLANGLKLIVAERHEVPMIDFRLLVDAGYASDQFALPGTASLAMDMLDEGTGSRNALEISMELARLGATLGTGSNLDLSVVRLSTLTTKLDPALDLYADVILNPSFPEAEFERLQRQQIARIQREKLQPIQMALRVFPGLLYGEDHAYGNPFTGSGTEVSVAALTQADVAAFHNTWFKPGNSTMVIVGDTTMEQIRPKLEKLFSGWQPGEVPSKNITRVEPPDQPVVYIVDKPDALQSVLLAGVVAPPKSNPQEIAIETMNTVLGGAFVSRINMNLREDKHWSYGAGMFLPGARGQRPYLGYAAVQTDKTKESITEVLKELREILGDRPVNEEELMMAKSNLTLALPGSWETASSVSNSIAEIVRFNLPEDYHSTYAGKVKALDLEDMKSAAQAVVKPDNLVWVVIGDREKIEAGISELALGEIRHIDADGNPL